MKINGWIIGGAVAVVAVTAFIVLRKPKPAPAAAAIAAPAPAAPAPKPAKPDKFEAITGLIGGAAALIGQGSAAGLW